MKVKLTILIAWILSGPIGSADIPRPSIELKDLGGTQLGDRLILEIDQTIYSQREMEVYFSLLPLVSSEDKPLSLVNAQNWNLALERFATDMIIFLETKRLGRFQPSQERIQTLLSATRNEVTQNYEIQSLHKRLELNSSNIMENLMTLVQIDEFKKLKGAAEDRLWLSKLKEKYIIRRYQGAEFFRPIKFSK